VETYGKVRLTVYNLLGQTVRNLVRENQYAGAYLVTWDGRNNNGKQVASGIYYLKMEVLNGDKVLFQSSKKLMLVK
ncbi:MAG TPA: FlgD immunoglobulin-like domain containing protein, partial [Candidatus Marinimicrobia bacterium]|nr:FlgD immunoglobulin-like domain containing protein [Candidatus Neomarinimicrobiota bacterium]